ncbi:TetR/AcrR family transcriptional regulator [Nocardia sp. CC227C]|uniref:TetR/AcrR family transcriptional regulator n=1 Tax=Nocardia sp. CC227C TaxID=3044562 RepID=UPI00278C49BB|nr:TetR/AcrR family transcriptional regulator [Nocardia sp. CC227C]
MSAARTAFAAHGTELEIRSVAADAGVGVGTVFRNFPTKQQLVEAMAREWAAERDEALLRCLSVGDPWEAVVGHVRWCGEIMSREPGLRRLLTDVSAKAHLAGETDAAFVEGLAELIVRAQGARVLRPGVTAAGYYGLLVGLAVALSAGSDWRTMTDVIISGLRAP